jgi:ABC-type Zn uptake system ZnuABC Zn-binding protein ZnuA
MSTDLSAAMTIYCSHPELCKLIKVITFENKIHDIKTITLVNIAGDPHEFEPSTAEIKNLISAPILITGPNELNPWIKKIIFQRNKAETSKTISLVFDKNDYNLYQNTSGETLSHFWIYPRVYCSVKKKLELELYKINNKILFNHNCEFNLVEEKLKIVLSKNKLPIILTHNAIMPLLANLDNSNPIVAIKGSGHHEEASSDTVKNLYNALKAPSVIWIVESGINIPQNILNKIRPTDKLIKIDTANSKDYDAFSVLNELTEKLMSLNSK